MTVAKKRQSKRHAAKSARVTLRLGNGLDARLRSQAKRMDCSLTDLIVTRLAAKTETIWRARVAATLVQIETLSQTMRAVIAANTQSVDAELPEVKAKLGAINVKLDEVIEKTRTAMAILTEPD